MKLRFILPVAFLLCSPVSSNCWAETTPTTQKDSAVSSSPSSPSVSLSLLRDTQTALTRAQRFLVSQQTEQGAWKGDPAITAMVLYALLLDPIYNPDLKTEMALSRAFTYLEDFVKPDGGIYRKDYAHYTTAVCLLALTESRQAKYRDIIRNARAYLIAAQCDESENISPAHPYYGGIGYGGDDRPDLSNTHLALEGIRAADRYEARFTPSESATVELAVQKNPDLHWKKALVFLARCQNLKSVNSMEYAADDGGFIYETGTYKPERSHSYGSMTYAGVKSLVYAKVDRHDVRVQKAVDWIREHYTWTENPGFGTTSLFYYYMTGAKCLDALGLDVLDTKTGKHHWREDLIRQILSLQNEDGSWQNSNGQYWENMKDLSTAYNLIALKFCLRGLWGNQN